MKSISLIEDDDDGCEVIISGDDQAQVKNDADGLWESVMDTPNKGFSPPEPPSTIELDEGGSPYCVLKLSWPIGIVAEVVTDWLKENAKEFRRIEETFEYE
jgi:hypothetical protein